MMWTGTMKMQQNLMKNPISERDYLLLRVLPRDGSRIRPTKIDEVHIVENTEAGTVTAYLLEVEAGVQKEAELEIERRALMEQDESGISKRRLKHVQETDTEAHCEALSGTVPEGPEPHDPREEVTGCDGKLQAGSLPPSDLDRKWKATSLMPFS